MKIRYADMKTGKLAFDLTDELVLGPDGKTRVKSPEERLAGPGVLETEIGDNQILNLRTGKKRIITKI